jgi:hypothetical protein
MKKMTKAKTGLSVALVATLSLSGYTHPKQQKGAGLDMNGNPESCFTQSEKGQDCENHGQSHARQTGSTMFALLEQEKTPVELSSITISRSSAIRHIRIKNVSNKEITGYQLGWIVSNESQPASVTVGPELRLEKNLASSKSVEVVDHPFPSSFFAQSAENKKVNFFVAAVTFADGSSWKAIILGQIERGRRNFRLLTLLPIAVELETTAAELLIGIA